MDTNAPSSGRGPVIRYLVVLAVGYVFGAKAGRRRYEQIAGHVQSRDRESGRQGRDRRRTPQDRKSGLTRSGDGHVDAHRRRYRGAETEAVAKKDASR